MKKILVATDFSTCAQAALDLAARMAGAMQAELTLLHVYTLPGYALPDGTLYTLDPETVKSIERSIQDQLALEQKRAGAPMELQSAEGNPAEVIAAQTRRGFDLLVMGTHGRTGLKRLLLGSIAERLLRTAACPVLVVRHPE